MMYSHLALARLWGGSGLLSRGGVGVGFGAIVAAFRWCLALLIYC